MYQIKQIMHTAYPVELGSEGGGVRSLAGAGERHDWTRS